MRPPPSGYHTICAKTPRGLDSGWTPQCGSWPQLASSYSPCHPVPSHAMTEDPENLVGNATGGADNIAELTDVLRAIHSAKPNDLPKALDQLTTAAATSVPGAQYAGITVSSRQNEVGTPSVSHRYPGILDEIQQRHLEGPCLQAAWSRETVIVDDLDSDHRWPRYRGDALAQTPIRSIASLPIFADELLMGALNIFAEATHVFDEKALEAARIFAVLGSLAWSNVVRKQQFELALSSRDVIGQAKGILMERYSIDDRAAFAMLVKMSQESHVRLSEVGRRVAETDHPTSA